jgi:hypothetical protein
MIAVSWNSPGVALPNGKPLIGYTAALKNTYGMPYTVGHYSFSTGAVFMVWFSIRASGFRHNTLLLVQQDNL